MLDPVPRGFGAWSPGKPLLLRVNDLLMAGLLLVIGLEIKREVLIGELAGWQRASLPAADALGGRVVPALIDVAFWPHADGSCRREVKATGDQMRRSTGVSGPK